MFKIKKAIGRRIAFLAAFAAVLSIWPVSSMAASYSDDQIKTLYEPETGIVAAPTVIQKIDTAEKLQALNTTEARAQVARFTLADVQLNVNIGGVSYTLEDVLAVCGTKVLPMFVTSDSDTATTFVKQFKRRKDQDVLLASDNIEALRRAWNLNSTGVRYAYLAGSVSPENTVSKIARSAHTASATTVLLDDSLKLTREAVEYLQLRGLSVWLTYARKSDEYFVRRAIDTGANGVSVRDFSKAYSLYKKVKDTTTVRRTFVVAHRGFSAAAPENSRESYLEAVKAGAEAIECDVRMTKDGVLVSIHNDTIDGYTTDATATGAVSSLTWEELSSYTLLPKNGYEESKFCKMEWYFQVLKDNPGVVGFVELKDSSEELIQKTVALIKEMEIEDQICFISFGDNALQIARSMTPHIGTGKLRDSFYDRASSVNSNLMRLMQDIGLSASMADYGQSDVTNELVAAGRHRGILFGTWTVNDWSTMRNQLKWGITTITTDYADRVRDDAFTAYKSVTALKLFGSYTEPPETDDADNIDKPISVPSEPTTPPTKPTEGTGGNTAIPTPVSRVTTTVQEVRGGTVINFGDAEIVIEAGKLPLEGYQSNSQVRFTKTRSATDRISYLKTEGTSVSGGSLATYVFRMEVIENGKTTVIRNFDKELLFAVCAGYDWTLAAAANPYVLKTDEGIAQALSTGWDADAGVLSFLSDRTGRFTIWCVSDSGGTESPPTGEDSATFTMVILTAVCLFAVFVLLYKWRRLTAR